MEQLTAISAATQLTLISPFSGPWEPCQVSNPLFADVDGLNIFEMLAGSLLPRKAMWRQKISWEGDHVHNYYAHLRRRMEPALFPSAKRELSLT